MKRIFLVWILVLLILVLLVFSSGSLPLGEKSSSNRGRLYIIGTGPAGPQMATLQALETIKRMDAVAASDNLIELFKDYIGDKPVLFDPWKSLFDFQGKHLRKLTGEERAMFIKERTRVLEERTQQIEGLIAGGKNIGLLDSGNPSLFAPCQLYADLLDEQDLVVIPGMGSDAAAMAALGKSVIPAHDARFLIQTSPLYLMSPGAGGMQMLEDLGKYPHTMVLYMALEMPERLFSILAEVYPQDMPCAVVYWAGFPEKERILRGTVADMAARIAQVEEKYTGLLVIGRFLEGKPYAEAIQYGKRQS